MVFGLGDVLHRTTPEAQRPETWHAPGTDVADWPQFQQNTCGLAIAKGRKRTSGSATRDG
jgi:hypothetical protein